MASARVRALILRLALSVGLLASCAACGSSEEARDPGGGAGVSPASAGPHPVGVTTVEWTDAARARSLTVEIWYPAEQAARAAAEEGEPIQNLASGNADRYASLLAAAPPECPTRRTHSARSATPAEGRFPVLVFSHCHGCVRFSGLSIAERLASHGFVVAAADHAGNTLFDELDGTGVALGSEFLQVRGADVRFVLDQLLDDSALPGALRGHVDAERVGVFGHSFGGVTTGLVLQDDPRPRAGLSIAAPVENPLLAGVDVTAIHVPLTFLVAKEDNSITEIGNNLIRDNFASANPPVTKLEVPDAGHWSFSDVCGVVDDFMPGCGDGIRQTDREPFTYLPTRDGLAIAAAYTTAFFRAELMGDAASAAYLAEAHPASIEVETRR